MKKMSDEEFMMLRSKFVKQAEEINVVEEAHGDEAGQNAFYRNEAKNSVSKRHTTTATPA